MLEIEVGQKAVIVASEEFDFHSFKVGEVVEFCEYGIFQEEDNYYEYKFVNDSGLHQLLVKEDFELL